MRLAWFTPWPPQASGIAGRSAELTTALSARGHAIDVFVDDHDASLTSVTQRTSDDGPAAGEIRVQSAHNFVWRAFRGQYDLPVYQMGNSRLHEYIWPYLFRWPGLSVLHDARLHHARGRALLRRGRADDYRAEFAWNHPDASVDLAELAVRGFSGAYYYQWPMTRGVVRRSRLTVCHARGAADVLAADFPDALVEYAAMGEGPLDYDVPAAGHAFRRDHGIDDSAVIFGVHGGLTSEKRVPQILRAFAATRPWLGNSRLLLAGRPDPAIELDRLIAELGLRDVTHVVTALDDLGFDRAIAATDVSLNLRWPTALETSGPWLRSLAMRRATVIIDLPHQNHLPVLDPRTWRRHGPCDDLSAEADARAIAVALDILDEEHSLRLAMRRLAVDADLRMRLGEQARAYWQREHTMAKMIDDFERVAHRAAGAPMPPVGDAPAHMVPDPEAFARTLVEPLGVAGDLLTLS